jgi:internalin A
MIRTIIALLTGLALGSTGTADDAALVKRVAELGGKIERVDKKPTGPIIDIDLDRKATTDADLKLIAGATGLQYLNLSKAKITDDGLKEIAKLTKLRHLTLDETQISGKGLKHLTGLKLVSLSLSECPVDDAALESVGKIKTLERLTLWDQKAVTDAGLKNLSGLNQFPC